MQMINVPCLGRHVERRDLGNSQGRGILLDLGTVWCEIEMLWDPYAGYRVLATALG